MNIAIRAKIRRVLEEITRRWRMGNREEPAKSLPFGKPIDPYWFRQMKIDKARAARKRPRRYSDDWMGGDDV